jgi:hypothetical protein
MNPIYCKVVAKLAADNLSPQDSADALEKMEKGTYSPPVVGASPAPPKTEEIKPPKPLPSPFSVGADLISGAGALAGKAKDALTGAVMGWKGVRPGMIDPNKAVEVSKTDKSFADVTANAFKKETDNLGKANAAYEAAKQKEANPWGDFWDWAKSDWKHLLVPAGAVALLFGNDWMKAAGAAAMAWGGINLYNRMEALKEDPEIQQAIIKYAKSNFQGIDEALKLEKPKVQQAVKDYLAIVRFGGKDLIASQTAQAMRNKFKGIAGTQHQDLGQALWPEAAPKA